MKRLLACVILVTASACGLLGESEDTTPRGPSRFAGEYYVECASGPFVFALGFTVEGEYDEDGALALREAWVETAEGPREAAGWLDARGGERSALATIEFDGDAVEVELNDAPERGSESSRCAIVDDGQRFGGEATVEHMP